MESIETYGLLNAWLMLAQPWISSSVWGKSLPLSEPWFPCLPKEMNKTNSWVTVRINYEGACIRLAVCRHLVKHSFLPSSHFWTHNFTEFGPPCSGFLLILGSPCPQVTRMTILSEKGNEKSICVIAVMRQLLDVLSRWHYRYLNPTRQKYFSYFNRFCSPFLTLSIPSALLLSAKM